jgi:hypothetical protein
MKQGLLVIFALVAVLSKAQDGLEGVYIEKYYVSKEADSKGAIFSGELPAGSVTYRIWVDLKQGYRFQAAFGAPGHPLVLRSKAPFFNHLQAGTANPGILPERSLNKDIALLDSWLSAGGAGENHYGIQKRYDSDSPDELIRFEEGYFTNSEGLDYTPRMRDGMVRSDFVPFPTFFQIDSALYHLGSAIHGDSIVINNGAWACMGKGAMGADSLTTNTVLIAQLTTIGGLHLELNLLIGAPNGSSQKYFARTKDVSEWTHKDLVQTIAPEQKKKRKNRMKKSTTTQIMQHP